jgi:hypothetical protein
MSLSYHKQMKSIMRADAREDQRLLAALEAAYQAAPEPLSAEARSALSDAALLERYAALGAAIQRIDVAESELHARCMQYQDRQLFAHRNELATRTYALESASGLCNASPLWLEQQEIDLLLAARGHARFSDSFNPRLVTLREGVVDALQRNGAVQDEERWHFQYVHRSHDYTEVRGLFHGAGWESRHDFVLQDGSVLQERHGRWLPDAPYHYVRVG